MQKGCNEDASFESGSGEGIYVMHVDVTDHESSLWLPGTCSVSHGQLHVSGCAFSLEFTHYASFTHLLFTSNWKGCPVSKVVLLLRGRIEAPSMNVDCARGVVCDV